MNILAKNIMEISLKAKEKEDQIGSISSFYLSSVQKENVLNPIFFQLLHILNLFSILTYSVIKGYKMRKYVPVYGTVYFSIIF